MKKILHIGFGHALMSEAIAKIVDGNKNDIVIVSHAPERGITINEPIPLKLFIEPFITKHNAPKHRRKPTNVKPKKKRRK